jgi:glucosamine--fructose-6-phosphate aminotransferase (isomerizing)
VSWLEAELREQPEALARLLDRSRPAAREAAAVFRRRGVRYVLIASRGSSSNVARYAQYLLGRAHRVPVMFATPSLYTIYEQPPRLDGAVVVGISQSGESRDTVNAVRLAREHGARTLAITNLMGTQITREVDATLFTRCGMEVGVAATKTFTAQVALLSLLALKLAEIRRTLPQDDIEFILDRLHELPEKMQEFLDGEHPIDAIAERFHESPFFLYLGRHIGLPVALEGALKLKEISYIQETRARGAHVIAIATRDNEDIQHHADDVIYVPHTPAFLQAALAVVPLQLLAYKIARLRGLNVDQPRNLAKTVTVE